MPIAMAPIGIPAFRYARKIRLRHRFPTALACRLSDFVMSREWYQFYASYRPMDPTCVEDLFIQTGLTIVRRPLSPEMYSAQVERMIGLLGPRPKDHLVDLCCGNGISTREFAARVGWVSGLDFTARFLSAARRFCARPNIRYQEADVLAPWPGLPSPVGPPTCYSMTGSLGHFTPADFGSLLDRIQAVQAGRAFRLMLFNAPDFERRRNFYNTPERWARHEGLVAAGDGFNDGIGRWWKASEIEGAARDRGLRAQAGPQPDVPFNYRLEAP
jgi:SAM-dependent methyltransferase